jgi:Tripartite tricarboxylate transporter family receptor
MPVKTRCRGSRLHDREVAGLGALPSFPAKAEFIGYVKANPGKINFASGGIGFATHVTGRH